MIALSQDELIIQNAAARVGATAVIISAHNAHELKGTDMGTTTQRDRLEARRDQLIRMLQSDETVFRARITNELKDVATQLEALQMGTHWTQAQGDTLAKIVSNEIGLSAKVMK